MPKVSVLVAAYNCEAYVEDAIRSVMGQTESDLEIVVINDGSTDNTLAILNELAKCDSRIHIHSQANSGKLAAVRNVGIARARGEFIVFLDADDVYRRDKLERQLDVFNAFPEVDLVFSDMQMFWRQPDEPQAKLRLKSIGFVEQAADYLSDKGNDIYLCREDFYTFLSVHCTVTAVTAPSAMLRKKLLDDEDVWFPENTDVLTSEDADFFFRLAKGKRLAYIDQPLNYYRQHASSITHSTRAEKLMACTIQAHTLNLTRGIDVFNQAEIKTYKAKIAEYWFDLGYYFFQLGQTTQARGAYYHSLRLQVKLKYLTAILKTFLPKSLLSIKKSITVTS